MKRADEPVFRCDFIGAAYRILDSGAHFSESRKAVNRIRNLLALTSRYCGTLQPAQVEDICAGRSPITISPLTAGVLQTVRAYDFLREQALAGHMDTSPTELIYQLAVMCCPFRSEFWFQHEELLLQRVRGLTIFPSVDQGGWVDIFMPFFLWKRCSPPSHWVVGVATLLYFLSSAFRVAPTTSANCDYSQTLLLLQQEGVGINDIPVISKMLYNAVPRLNFATRQRSLAGPEAKLLPLLDLLADGQAMSAKEIMTRLGITSRGNFMDELLTPALEGLLVVHTEDNAQSPRQKYRLSDMGCARLKTTQGVIE